MNCPSQIAQISKGPIEYAFHGEGPTILSIHGGPGGYDQGLMLAEPFRTAGFRILAVSRPGYLRTPLEVGKMWYEQADVYAELLDKLGLDKVFLIHASAGGPSGYTFANNYSNRVLAQIAIDSVCMKYEIKITKTEEVIYLSKFGMWLTNFITEHLPKVAIKQMVETEGSLDHPDVEKKVSEILKDPIKMAFFKGLIKTMGATRFAERKAGTDNDIQTFKEIDKLELSNITCPTLIMHGDHDKDVVPEHAEYAHKSIPNSELHWILNATHLGFYLAQTADIAQEKAINFLRQHSS